METLSDTKLDDLKRKLGSSQNDTLYVGNLPYHFELLDVKNLLKDCGQIRQVELKKGFAFVQMADAKGVKRVLNYEGHKVMGRPLKIKIKEKQEERRNERSRSRSPPRERRAYRGRSRSPS